MKNFVQGTLIRIKASFADINGTPTDPSTITFKVQDPNGAKTTYVYPSTIAKSSTGVYYIDVNLNVPLIWSFRYEGTGSITAASQAQVNCIAANPT